MYARHIGTAAAWIGLLGLPAFAQTSSVDHWRQVSDLGAYGLVGMAMALPACKGDWEGFRQAGCSLALASGIGIIGKTFVDKERPDKSDDDSFPSNHSGNAFAAATTMHRRYGWQVGFPAYGAATLVGVARIHAEKHFWEDVVVGALIGTLAGRFFTDAYDSNVRLVPWASRNSVGVELTFSW